MSSLFWIESDDVEGLIEGAGWRSAARAPAQTRRPQRPAPVETPTTAAIDEVASSPRAPTTAAGKALELETPPDASFEARVEALLDAVAAATGAETLFLADEQGLVLAAREASAALIAAGAALVGHWREVRTELDLSGSGCLNLDLGAGGRLDLIPAVSSWGVMSLGIVTRDSVAPAIRDHIVDALLRTLPDREGNSV